MFEFEYMGRLRGELGRHGLLIEYGYDRAALDLGVHLYAGPASPDGSRQVAGGRVWVQAKGIRAATLPADRIAASPEAQCP